MLYLVFKGRDINARLKYRAANSCGGYLPGEIRRTFGITVAALNAALKIGGGFALVCHRGEMILIESDPDANVK